MAIKSRFSVRTRLARSLWVNLLYEEGSQLDT